MPCAAADPRSSASAAGASDNCTSSTWRKRPPREERSARLALLPLRLTTCQTAHRAAGSRQPPGQLGQQTSTHSCHDSQHALERRAALCRASWPPHLLGGQVGVALEQHPHTVLVHQREVGQHAQRKALHRSVALPRRQQPLRPGGEDRPSVGYRGRQRGEPRTGQATPGTCRQRGRGEELTVPPCTSGCARCASAGRPSTRASSADPSARCTRRTSPVTAGAAAARPTAASVSIAAAAAAQEWLKTSYQAGPTSLEQYDAQQHRPAAQAGASQGTGPPFAAAAHLACPLRQAPAWGCDTSAVHPPGSR